MTLRIPACDPATLPAEVLKTASATQGAGLAALLGLAFSQARKMIPGLDQIRETNPSAYDAALGASVVMTLNQLEGKDEGRPGELQPGAMVPPGYTV